MSARFLMALFDSIYVIALAAWIGSALFLSLGLIPLIVKQLGPEPAEKLVRALLPRYCVWGAICGALALSSMVAVPLCYPEYRGVKVGVQALAIISCILITLYVGNSKTSVRNEPRGTGLVLPGAIHAAFSSRFFAQCPGGDHRCGPPDRLCDPGQPQDFGDRRADPARARPLRCGHWPGDRTDRGEIRIPPAVAAKIGRANRSGTGDRPRDCPGN